MPETQSTLPSAAWIRRFAPLVTAGGSVLDIACGAGRHASLFADLGYRVTAADRDASRLVMRTGVGSALAPLRGDPPRPFPGGPLRGVAPA